MRTAIYILLGSAALLVFIVLGLQWWLGAKIRRTAMQEVADRTDGSFRLGIGHVGVSLLSRTVTLNEVTVSADTARLADYLPCVDSVGAQIEKIVLRGVRFRFKGDDKYLSLRALEIDHPNVSLTFDGKSAADSAASDSLKGLREQLAERFGRLSVDRMRLRDADLRITNSTRNSYTAKGLTVEADGFRLDPAGAEEDPRPLFCDDIRLSVAKASVRFLVTAQLLEAESIALGIREGSLSLENVRMIPQYGKAEYAWKVARHTDWTQAIAGNIDARGIDFGRLWRDTVLSMETLTLKDVEVASYKNRRIVRQERFKPLLSEMVQGVPFGLEIGTAEIVNANAVYEELSATGERPGRITFDSLNGVFKGLTNRPDSLDFFYTLTASGKVMKTGHLRVVVRFPAHSSNDRFEVEGTLGSVNLKVFNHILEPLAEAGIHSGHLDGLSFSIVGDRREAHVTMKMRYNDLSVMLLREGRNGRLQERRLMSGIVNLMLIKSSNPDRKGLRMVQDAAVRDTSRSQFNYLWKTLLVGIKGSVGFPGAK